MQDEIKPVEQMENEDEFPFVRVVCRPNGPSYEISANMSSLILFGICAQLERMATTQFAQEFGQALPKTQQQIAIARGLPTDFKQKRRN